MPGQAPTPPHSQRYWEIPQDLYKGPLLVFGQGSNPCVSPALGQPPALFFCLLQARAAKSDTFTFSLSESRKSKSTEKMLNGGMKETNKAK